MFIPSTARFERRVKETAGPGNQPTVSLSSLNLVIVPRRVAAWLSGILLFLLIAHGMGLLMTFGFGYDYVHGLVPLFNIGLESNVPTYFATALFFLNALLFAILACSGTWEARQRRVWALLAAVFCFLSLDEFAMIHEKLIEPVRAMVSGGGFLYFAWVLPYALAVTFLGIIAAPVLWGLGSRFRVLFGLGAAVFLFGAMGVEMLGGRYYEEVEGSIDLNYRLFQTAEESLEFAGLIILVYTLLELLRASSPVTRIQLKLQARAGVTDNPDA